MSDTYDKIGKELLTVGYNAWVRVGESASTAKYIGYVDSFQATKSISLQKAYVLGALMPASIDAQQMAVNLSLSGFMGVPEAYSESGVRNGEGSVSIASFNPNDEQFQNNAKTTKFAYMDFVKKTKNGEVILASFNMCIANNFSIQSQAGSYVKANIGMEAISFNIPDEFRSGIENFD